MLKKIRIRNFKCYGPQGADFNLAKVNFIYGDNSVGKSSFLQFLELLFKGADINRYTKESFDRHLFKGRESNGASVSAQLRLVNDHGHIPVERVFRFGEVLPSDGGEGYYALSSSDGTRIDGSAWDAFLPKGGGQSRVLHKIAPRALKEQESTVKGVSGLMDTRFLAKVELETNQAAADYLDDILTRLGVPYSCARNEDGQIDTARIRDKDFGIDLNVQDVGTGIAGLMDLAFTLKAWKGGILALEEPETNVNEAQLAALVEVLVQEALARDEGQLIVECHSKLMVQKLAALVKQGELVSSGANANLAVICVNKRENGSVAMDATIGEDGRIVWPMGFFPAEGEILRAMYGVKRQ